MQTTMIITFFITAIATITLTILYSLGWKDKRDTQVEYAIFALAWMSMLSFGGIWML